MDRTFFETLYGACRRNGGLVEFRLLKDTGKARRYWYLVNGPQFSSGEAEAILDEHSSKGWNIYFGVALRNMQEQPAFVPALWIDVDFKDLEDGFLDPETRTRLALANADCPPSLIVQSGGGIHAYWVLREPIVGEDKYNWVEKTNRKLAVMFNGDSVGDRARILRVPGYPNWKYDPPRQCVTLAANDRRYDSTDLEDWLAAIPEKQIPRRVENLIQYGNTGEYKSRSEADFAVIRALLAGGFTTEEIERIFTNEKVGEKFREQNHKYAHEYLRRTICAARDTIEGGCK